VIVDILASAMLKCCFGLSLDPGIGGSRMFDEGQESGRPCGGCKLTRELAMYGSQGRVGVLDGLSGQRGVAVLSGKLEYVLYMKRCSYIPRPSDL
jgi:hypothetical protein